jgi:hypothetical protein
MVKPEIAAKIHGCDNKRSNFTFSGFKNRLMKDSTPENSMARLASRI